MALGLTPALAPKNPTVAQPPGQPGYTPPQAANPAASPLPSTPAGGDPLAGTGLDYSALFSGSLPASVTQAPGGQNIADLYPALQQYQLDPALQELLGQTGLATTSAGFTQQQLGLQGSQAQQEAGFSQQQLGLQQAGNTLSQQALQAQAGPGGFQSQQAGLTAAQQAQSIAQQQRSLRSGATASGSTSASGTRQSWSDILAQQGFQKQQQQLTAAEQQQQYQTSQQQLTLAGKQLGISGAEVTSRLNNAIAQLGLQGQVDANSLMQQIGQLQQGFLSGPLSSVMQEIMSSAGLPIQAFTPSTTPGGGLTGGPVTGGTP